MTINQNTLVTIVDASARVAEMPLNPATIKKRLAAVWNIPHQIIIDLEYDLSLSDPRFTAKIPVASWQQCPQSQVEGKVFMGPTVAYVSLRHSELIRQESEREKYMAAIAAARNA